MNLFSEQFHEIQTQAEFDSFAAKNPQYDTGYLFQACVEERRKARKWLEKMWQQYEPHADSNFHKEFRTRFTERAWELYLGATMINQGFSLGKHLDHFPDLDVRTLDGKNRVAWVEAIAVNKGTGPDRVPEMSYGVSVGLPDDEMSLRVTQALKDKHDQYQARLAKGIVAPSEPYVIAIDRSELSFPEFTPLILRVVYGIGQLTLSFPVPEPGEPHDRSEGESFYQRQESIAKKSGEAISSTFFLNPAHAGISAAIYSTHGILNLPRAPHELGESFIIAHNPCATNPIVGVFSFGEEYKGDENGARMIRPRKEYMRPDAFEHLYP